MTIIEVQALGGDMLSSMVDSKRHCWSGDMI